MPIIVSTPLHWALALPSGGFSSSPFVYILGYLPYVHMSNSSGKSGGGGKQKLQDRVGAMEFSLKYPLTNTESKWNPILFGVLMNLISFLIIPLFTQIGYVFKIREYAAKGEAEAPLFEDFVDLTKEGLLATLLFVGIFVLFVVLAALFQFVLGDLAGLPIVVLYFGLLYVIPAVSMLYSVHRDYSETVSRLPEVVTSGWYVKASLLYVVFAFGLIFGFMLLGLLTLGFGFLVLVPFLLYVRPCYWGHAYYQNKSKLSKP